MLIKRYSVRMSKRPIVEKTHLKNKLARFIYLQYFLSCNYVSFYLFYGVSLYGHVNTLTVEVHTFTPAKSRNREKRDSSRMFLPQPHFLLHLPREGNDRRTRTSNECDVRLARGFVWARNTRPRTRTRSDGEPVARRRLRKYVIRLDST